VVTIQWPDLPLSQREVGSGLQTVPEAATAGTLYIGARRLGRDRMLNVARLGHAGAGKPILFLCGVQKSSLIYLLISKVGHMSDQWTEVNLVPPRRDDKLRVLLEVIDPLVHEELNSDIESWFYSNYDSPAPPHLRLRILWKSEIEIARAKGELFDFLDDKKNDGTLVDCFEGSHGVRGLIYPGEPDEHEGMWEVTYKLWASQSEYALELLRLESANSLTKHHLPWHWSRSVHMLSNPLFLNLLDEVYLSLTQGSGYLRVLARDTTDTSFKSWCTSLAEDVEQVQQKIVTDAKPALDESIRKVIDDPSSY
jgi:hypothetical protein